MIQLDSDTRRDSTVVDQPMVSVDIGPEAESGPQCEPTAILCGMQCVAPATDRLNCGGCGIRCADGEQCQSGRCEPNSCAPGTSDCDGNPANGCETNTQTAVMHCGSCNQACSFPNANSGCESGRCVIASCTNGRGDCDRSVGNGCETLLNTAANCGSCGTVCAAPNPVCDLNRGCVAACGNGQTLCSGSCAALSTDRNNCGQCGNVCGNANGTGICNAGMCSIMCNVGFANCDGMQANGCETDVRNSNAHCGGCGRACAAGLMCVAGSCEPVSIAPTAIPNTQNCVLGRSYAGKKAAIDAAGTMYLAMMCGSNLSVSVSRNNGATWSAPVPTGLSTLNGNNDFAIAARPDGGVIVANARAASGDVDVSSSPDGVMWGGRTAAARDAAPVDPSGLVVSILQRGTTILIAYTAQNRRGITVVRNTNAGQGIWNSVNAGALGGGSPELMSDPMSNSIWLGGDRMAPLRSTDDGLSFTELGRQFSNRSNTDYAIGNGFFIEAGSTAGLDRNTFTNLLSAVPMPPTTIQLAGAPSPTTARCVAADQAGTVYVVTGTAGAPTLQRILAGAMMAEAPTNIPVPNVGLNPTIATLLRNRGVFGAVQTGAFGGVAAFVQTY